jgi:hypothetical protein
VNALRQIHAHLVPHGLLVDTQPVSAQPPIRQGAAELGTLDMGAWAETIEAVDGRTALVVDEGLYRLEHERSLVVADAYDDGPDLISDVQNWQGTRIPPTLARTLRGVSTPVRVDQEIRLRLYRALPATDIPARRAG